MHQMEVNIVFLNESHDTDIYMSQPEGFVNNQNSEYVCKLNKSLYELILSSRCWNTMLGKFLISSGYHKRNADGCVYIKLTKKADGTASFIILAVYVDDIIPLSNDIELLKIEKASLCTKFHNPTKHIDILCHFKRERILAKEIMVNYSPTDNMLADAMTKGFGRVKLNIVKYIEHLSS